MRQLVSANYARLLGPTGEAATGKLDLISGEFFPIAWFRNGVCGWKMLRATGPEVECSVLQQIFDALSASHRRDRHSDAPGSIGHFNTI